MLTTEAVQHIALLARIGVKEDEIEQYRQELSAVLDFFRALETVTTDDVAVAGHIAGTTERARTDRAEEFDASGKKMILSNIPELKGGFVKVKSVF